MSRHDRFSRLEGEREGGGEPPGTGASLERFGAEPELSPRAEPVDPMAPVEGAQRLRRFEEDGNQGLGLDRDPLAALPMLECPACAMACGKFEVACHGCGSSLTSPAAREHNLKRLEARQAEQGIAREAQRVQRELEAHAVAQEFHPDLSGESTSKTRRRLQKLAVGAVALGLTVFGKGGVAVFGLVLLAGVTLALLPRWAWVRLGQKARFRDRD